MLDFRLGQRERKCTLGHELTHDEFDLVWPRGTPRALTAKGEEFVRRVTAERLVPLDELDRYVTRQVGIDEPVHAAAVADEFAVTIDVAHKALWLLGQRRAS